MHRVYLESSVWGMADPSQPPSLRDPTVEFLELCQGRVYLPHISEVVALEVGRAPQPTQEFVLDRISALHPLFLPMPAAAEELARRFIDQGVLTSRRLNDARHVACAVVNEMDLLVSWNYRHIANVRKADGFNAVAVLCGYRSGLAIHTPLEVLEWQ